MRAKNEMLHNQAEEVLNKRRNNLEMSAKEHENQQLEFSEEEINEAIRQSLV